MKLRLVFSLGIHSNGLKLFRIWLAILTILEGIKLGTIHSLMIVSEHRLFEMQWHIWHGDNSRINLFQASSSHLWPTILILLYIYCGIRLFQEAGGCAQWVSWTLFFLKNSINAQVSHCCSTGDIFLGVLFFMNVYFPKDLRGEGKWHYTPTTACYYIIVITLYVFAGFHKLFDVDWTSGEALQLIFFNSYSNEVGLFLAENYPTLCMCLTHSTFVLEMIVPFLLLDRRTRLFATVSLIAFHFGISLTMAIENFPYISICSLVVFLPPLSKLTWTGSAGDALEIKDDADWREFEGENSPGKVSDNSTKDERKRERKRSKTPARKRPKRYVDHDVAVKSPEVAFGESNDFSKQGIYAENSEQMRWSVATVCIPAFYTLLFLLSACSELYEKKIYHVLSDELKDELPLKIPFFVNVKRLINLIDVPGYWGVFTSDTNVKTRKGSRTVTWTIMPGKLCAKQTGRANGKAAGGDAFEPQCRWVDLKYSLGSVGLSESIFPPVLHKFFRNLWLPAHKYFTVFSEITAVPSSWSMASDISNKISPSGMVLPSIKYGLGNTAFQHVNGYASNKWFKFVNGWGYKSYYREKLARYICKRLNKMVSTVNGVEYVFTMPTIEFVTQWQSINYNNRSIRFIERGCENTHGRLVWRWGCNSNQMYDTDNHIFHNKCYNNDAEEYVDDNRGKELGLGSNKQETSVERETPTEQLPEDSVHQDIDEEDIDDDADLVPFADMEEGGDDDDDDDDDDEGEACKSHCGWKKDYNELVDDFYDSEDDELLVDDIEFDSDDDDKDIPADGTEVGVIPEEEDCRKKRCSFEEVVSTWDKGETW